MIVTGRVILIAIAILRLGAAKFYRPFKNIFYIFTYFFTKDRSNRHFLSLIIHCR